MDGLGERMHGLAKAAGDIKREATFEAHSTGQQCFKIMVVGVEGTGKSTSLNSLLRELMMPDAQLAQDKASLQVSFPPPPHT